MRSCARGSRRPPTILPALALAALRAAGSTGGSAGAGNAAAGVATVLGQLRGLSQRDRVAAETALWLTGWDGAQIAAALLDALPLPENPDPAVLRARASTL